MIIPESILFFMSWEDLDIRSTGSKTIDISTLKSITVYSVTTYSLTIIVMQLRWPNRQNVLECLRNIYRGVEISVLEIRLGKVQVAHEFAGYQQKALDWIFQGKNQGFSAYFSHMFLYDRLATIFVWRGNETENPICNSILRGHRCWQRSSQYCSWRMSLWLYFLSLKMNLFKRSDFRVASNLREISTQVIK